MAEQSKYPNDLPEIPPLDSMTANQVLNNVFVACDRPLSKIPVETLEEWGNYKSYDFKICRRVAYVILAVLIFLPLNKIGFRVSIYVGTISTMVQLDALKPAFMRVSTF